MYFPFSKKVYIQMYKNQQMIRNEAHNNTNLESFCKLTN